MVGEMVVYGDTVPTALGLPTSGPKSRARHTPPGFRHLRTLFPRRCLSRPFLTPAPTPPLLTCVRLPGLDQGFEEDELLALEMGVASLAGLSETQRAYKDKIKQKLAKVGHRAVCGRESCARLRRCRAVGLPA